VYRLSFAILGDDAMQAWGWRIGLMAVVLAGVAVLYFGLLALLGLRPRQFIRHA